MTPDERRAAFTMAAAFYVFTCLLSVVIHAITTRTPPLLHP